jgi:hypothetical protein
MKRRNKFNSKTADKRDPEVSSQTSEIEKAVVSSDSARKEWPKRNNKKRRVE